jgi:hypothetical protein
MEIVLYDSMEDPVDALWADRVFDLIERLAEDSTYGGAA